MSEAQKIPQHRPTAQPGGKAAGGERNRMKNKKVVRMQPGRLTPGGSVMAEIYYFDEEDNPTPKSVATRVIIRELDENGNPVQEVFGSKSKG